jgi:hypothetical protein
VRVGDDVDRLETSLDAAATVEQGVAEPGRATDEAGNVVAEPGADVLAAGAAARGRRRRGVAEPVGTVGTVTGRAADDAGDSGAGRVEEDADRPETPIDLSGNPAIWSADRWRGLFASRGFRQAGRTTVSEAESDLVDSIMENGPAKLRDDADAWQVVARLVRSGQDLDVAELETHAGDLLRGMARAFEVDEVVTRFSDVFRTVDAGPVRQQAADVLMSRAADTDGDWVPPVVRLSRAAEALNLRGGLDRYEVDDAGDPEVRRRAAEALADTVVQVALDDDALRARDFRMADRVVAALDENIGAGLHSLVVDENGRALHQQVLDAARDDLVADRHDDMVRERQGVPNVVTSVGHHVPVARVGELARPLDLVDVHGLDEVWKSIDFEDGVFGRRVRRAAEWLVPGLSVEFDVRERSWESQAYDELPPLARAVRQVVVQWYAGDGGDAERGRLSAQAVALSLRPHLGEAGASAPKLRGGGGSIEIELQGQKLVHDGTYGYHEPIVESKYFDVVSEIRVPDLGDKEEHFEFVGRPAAILDSEIRKGERVDHQKMLDEIRRSIEVVFSAGEGYPIDEAFPKGEGFDVDAQQEVYIGRQVHQRLMLQVTMGFGVSGFYKSFEWAARNLSNGHLRYRQENLNGALLFGDRLAALFAGVDRPERFQSSDLSNTVAKLSERSYDVGAVRGHLMNYYSEIAGFISAKSDGKKGHVPLKFYLPLVSRVSPSGHYRAMSSKVKDFLGQRRDTIRKIFLEILESEQPDSVGRFHEDEVKTWQDLWGLRFEVDFPDMRLERRIGFVELSEVSDNFLRPVASAQRISQTSLGLTTAFWNVDRAGGLSRPQIPVEFRNFNQPRKENWQDVLDTFGKLRQLSRDVDDRERRLLGQGSGSPGGGGPDGPSGRGGDARGGAGGSGDSSRGGAAGSSSGTARIVEPGDVHVAVRDLVDARNSGGNVVEARNRLAEQMRTDIETTENKLRFARQALTNAERSRNPGAIAIAERTYDTIEADLKNKRTALNLIEIKLASTASALSPPPRGDSGMGGRGQVRSRSTSMSFGPGVSSTRGSLPTQVMPPRGGGVGRGRGGSSGVTFAPPLTPDSFPTSYPTRGRGGRGSGPGWGNEDAYPGSRRGAGDSLTAGGVVADGDAMEFTPADVVRSVLPGVGVTFVHEGVELDRAREWVVGDRDLVVGGERIAGWGDRPGVFVLDGHGTGSGYRVGVRRPGADGQVVVVDVVVGGRRMADIVAELFGEDLRGRAVMLQLACKVGVGPFREFGERLAALGLPMRHEAVTSVTEVSGEGLVVRDGGRLVAWPEDGGFADRGVVADGPVPVEGAPLAGVLRSGNDVHVVAPEPHEDLTAVARLEQWSVAADPDVVAVREAVHTLLGDQATTVDTVLTADVLKDGFQQALHRDKGQSLDVGGHTLTFRVTGLERVAQGDAGPVRAEDQDVTVEGSSATRSTTSSVKRAQSDYSSLLKVPTPWVTVTGRVKGNEATHSVSETHVSSAATEIVEHVELETGHFQVTYEVSKPHGGLWHDDAVDRTTVTIPMELTGERRAQGGATESVELSYPQLTGAPRDERLVQYRESARKVLSIEYVKLDKLDELAATVVREFGELKDTDEFTGFTRWLDYLQSKEPAIALFGGTARREFNFKHGGKKEVLLRLKARQASSGLDARVMDRGDKTIKHVRSASGHQARTSAEVRGLGGGLSVHTGDALTSWLGPSIGVDFTFEHTNTISTTDKEHYELRRVIDYSGKMDVVKADFSYVVAVDDKNEDLQAVTLDGSAMLYIAHEVDPDSANRPATPAGVDLADVPDLVHAVYSFPEEALQHHIGNLITQLQGKGYLRADDLGPTMANLRRFLLKNVRAVFSGDEVELGDPVQIPLGKDGQGPYLFLRGRVNRSGGSYYGPLKGRHAGDTVSHGRGHSFDRSQGVVKSASVTADGGAGPVDVSATVTVSSEKTRDVHISDAAETEHTWQGEGDLQRYQYPITLEASVGNEWGGTTVALDVPAEATMMNSVRVDVVERRGRHLGMPGHAPRQGSPWTKVDQATAGQDGGRSPSRLPLRFDVEKLKEIAGLGDAADNAVRDSTPGRRTGTGAMVRGAFKRLLLGSKVDVDPAKIGDWLGRDARVAGFNRTVHVGDRKLIDSSSTGIAGMGRGVHAELSLRTELDNPRIVHVDPEHEFSEKTQWEIGRSNGQKHDRGVDAQLQAGLSHEAAKWTSVSVGTTANASYRRGTEETADSNAATETTVRYRTRAYLVAFDARHVLTVKQQRSQIDAASHPHEGPAGVATYAKFQPDAVNVWVEAGDIPLIDLPTEELAQLVDEDRVEQSLTPPGDPGRGPGTLGLYRADALNELLHHVHGELDAWERHTKGQVPDYKLDRFEQLNDEIVDALTGEAVSGGAGYLLADMLNGGRPLLRVRATGESGTLEQLVIVSGRLEGGVHHDTIPDFHSTISYTTALEHENKKSNTLSGGLSAKAGFSVDGPEVPIDKIQERIGDGAGNATTKAIGYLAGEAVGSATDKATDFVKGHTVERLTDKVAPEISVTATRESGVLRQQLDTQVVAVERSGKAHRFDYGLTARVRVFPWTHRGAVKQLIGRLTSTTTEELHEVWESKEEFTIPKAVRLTVSDDDYVALIDPGAPAVRASLASRRAAGSAPKEFSDDALVRAYPFRAKKLHDELEKMAKGELRKLVDGPATSVLSAHRAHQLLAATTAGEMARKLPTALRSDGWHIDLDGRDLKSIDVKVDLNNLKLVRRLASSKADTTITNNDHSAGFLSLHGDVTVKVLEDSEPLQRGADAEHRRNPVDSERSASAAEHSLYLVRAQLLSGFTAHFRDGAHHDNDRLGPDGLVWMEVNEAGLKDLGFDVAEVRRWADAREMQLDPTPTTVARPLVVGGSGTHDGDARMAGRRRGSDDGDAERLAVVVPVGHDLPGQAVTSIQTEPVRATVGSGPDSRPAPPVDGRSPLSEDDDFVSGWFDSPSASPVDDRSPLPDDDLVSGWSNSPPASPIHPSPLPPRAEPDSSSGHTITPDSVTGEQNAVLDGGHGPWPGAGSVGDGSGEGDRSALPPRSSHYDLQSEPDVEDWPGSDSGSDEGLGVDDSSSDQSWHYYKTLSAGPASYGRGGSGRQHAG